MNITINSKWNYATLPLSRARKSENILHVMHDLTTAIKPLVSGRIRTEYEFTLEYSEFSAICKKNNVSAETVLKYVPACIDYSYNTEDCFKISVDEIDGELFTDFTETPHKSGLHAFIKNGFYIIADIKKQVSFSFDSYLLTFSTPEHKNLGLYISTGNINNFSTDFFVKKVREWIKEKYEEDLRWNCKKMYENSFYKYTVKELAEATAEELEHYYDTIRIDGNFIEWNYHSTDFFRYRLLETSNTKTELLEELKDFFDYVEIYA